jgi:hypothetical protein
MTKLNRTGLLAFLLLGLVACGAEEEGTVEMDSFDPGEGIAEDAPSGRAIIRTAQGDREVGYDVVGDHAIMEGDIDLGPVAELRRAGDPAPRSNVQLGGQWPSSTIFYVKPGFNVSAIVGAMNDIAAKTDITFMQLPTALPGIPMLQFFPSLDPGVSSSKVGYQGGLQTIRIWPTHGQGVVEHEVLHALGMWHEQQRLDRNNFININWFCMPMSRWHNFENAGLPIGSYDFKSIMHYSSFSFSNVDGCPVMTKKDGSTFSGNSVLSAGDIASLNLWY